jgi:hypothetical protein
MIGTACATGANRGAQITAAAKVTLIFQVSFIVYPLLS